MSQIGLPFEWAGQAKAGQFLLSDANHLAARHIENWRDWPLPISILTGPSRSGKSLAGRYFEQISGGEIIDDADRRADQELFHAWNMSRDNGKPLLLIAREGPELWAVTLPDLRSRLAAAPHVRIKEPDDVLVRGLIETGLAQAGSAYAPDLPEWLSRRIERSYAAVAHALDALNRLSLASGRKISIQIAKEALQREAFPPIVEPDSAPDEAQERND